MGSNIRNGTLIIILKVVNWCAFKNDAYNVNRQKSTPPNKKYQRYLTRYDLSDLKAVQLRADSAAAPSP